MLSCVFFRFSLRRGGGGGILACYESGAGGGNTSLGGWVSWGGTGGRRWERGEFVRVRSDVCAYTGGEIIVILPLTFYS
jgi:hypothetical protein